MIAALLRKVAAVREFIRDAPFIAERLRRAPNEDDYLRLAGRIRLLTSLSAYLLAENARLGAASPEKASELLDRLERNALEFFEPDRERLGARLAELTPEEVDQIFLDRAIAGHAVEGAKRVFEKARTELAWAQKKSGVAGGRLN